MTRRLLLATMQDSAGKRARMASQLDSHAQSSAFSKSAAEHAIKRTSAKLQAHWTGSRALHQMQSSKQCRFSANSSAALHMHTCLGYSDDAIAAAELAHCRAAYRANCIRVSTLQNVFASHKYDMCTLIYVCKG